MPSGAHPTPRRIAAWVCLSAAMAAGAAAETRPIDLAVDARDAPRGVFHCRLTIPAAPGPLTLAYPKWVQGEHTPTGPAMQVAGLSFTAGGHPGGAAGPAGAAGSGSAAGAGPTAGSGLAAGAGRAGAGVVPWHRDALDPFLIHVLVPAGARSVEAVFDYLSPPAGFGAGYGETPNATVHLAIVDWHDLVFFPLGVPAVPATPGAAAAALPGASAAAMLVRATLRLPAGWQFDSALAISGVAAAPDGTVTFSPTSLYTLIDSPVLAGEFFRTIEVASTPAPVRLSIAADRRSALMVPESRIAAYRRLPGEAEALFGTRHYRQYRWLLALGDTLDENGLEHHESSDDRGNLKMFADPAALLRWGTLLPHEFVHSWNGKYRRPAGLATGDPQQPLETELLWVYEGLTRYLGDFLLTARSGIRGLDSTREYAAYVAANQDRNRPGRSWRPLVDTASSVQLISAAPHEWTAYRRGLDYYDESALIWLEADTILRQESGGARSLDDFCRAFFGARGGGESTTPTVVPYSADDVYAALGRLVPYDWRAFFVRRVYDVNPRAPLGGLEAAGWKLVYDGRPNEYEAARAKTTGLVDVSFSLGLWLKEDGVIADIDVGSPAWEAGLGPGMKVAAVNGRKWAPEVLAEELAAATTSPEPLELTAEQGDRLRTFKVSYHRGELHPHLERDPTRPDLLSAILAPKAP